STNGLWSREHLYIVSGHPGPGVKDAIDYVTDVSRRDRFKCIVAEGCGMQCNSKMRYEWWVSDGEKTAKISLRPGVVHWEFYELSDRLGTLKTSKADIRSFSIFKVNLSTRIWNFPLEESLYVQLIDHPLEPGALPVEALAKDYFDSTVYPSI